MNNPWVSLPDVAPYVLPADVPVLLRFNEVYGTPQNRIQTHVLPEPFVGNVDAPVCLLGLNPGYSPSDDTWHGRDDFSLAIRKNLIHQPENYPFYFLDPAFSGSGGSIWWRNKLKQPLRMLGEEKVANGIFCVEFFPYHSVRYRAIPVSMHRGLLQSQQYSVHLVKRAISRGAHIVVMRSARLWQEYVPELATAPNVWQLNNPQNVTVSPNNLVGYDAIMDVLRAVG